MMKPNAIILHGTGATPDSFWYPSIRSALENQGYDVWVPKLPGADSPELTVQLPFIMENGTFTEQTVLIGHSSGCALILSALEKIKVKLTKVILVAGFARPLKKVALDIFPKRYDWKRIRNNANEFIIINSDDDPWGCDDREGRFLFNKLCGTFIVVHGQGHMGSDKYQQPFREFPLLNRLL
jgi:uncharacterized protein